ncbi:rhamnulokinase [Kutzneria sp. CA-103260]|uniref:rhamnulokinase n=1 Tax=Kutzneria sp. CA-103260 TaxID=2802641 RepID=UPI001BAE22A9|nr:rhamnulokinase family protein [Kutzneria sp. CA-103260]QUQ66645.1 carbohydrate kinase [Kutzneria sp. CA-103260]
MTSYAAVDLGASSGRVMLGRVEADLLELREVSRFSYRPEVRDGALRWDAALLRRSVEEGLRGLDVRSVGIDSWAVDYGLLDDSGELLADPVCYRDSRTDGVVDRVLAAVPAEELYGVTGIQILPINTLYQLVADPLAQQAAHLLLIPDLVAYWLTGEIGAEYTNASTTQLLDVHTGQWATGLMDRLGIPSGLFPPIRQPGSAIGGTVVVAVGSHDTASAVYAVPALTSRFGYISCGTWSLVGVELDRPVVTADSLAANFTNEAGVGGTVRYLRNVMGLWLLEESLRVWGLERDPLLRAAASLPRRSVIDPNASEFLPPGDMPSRIVAACRNSGQPVPVDPPEIVRCILDSLADAYRDTLLDAQRLSGKEIDVVHIVGGGSRNELLCQLTADACRLPVLAGPVEATALGNLLVQAGIPDPRRLVAATHEIRRYDPLA